MNGASEGKTCSCIVCHVRLVPKDSCIARHYRKYPAEEHTLILAAKRFGRLSTFLKYCTCDRQNILFPTPGLWKVTA